MVNNNIEAFDNEQVYKLSEFFKIISDSTRIKILSLLRCGEFSVGEIAKALDASLSAISHQLRILKQSNLIKYKKQGKNVIYCIADEHIDLIINVALEHLNEK